MPSQSPNPASQPPNTHCPPWHLGMLLGKAPSHVWPHAPQLDASVFTLVSQPSVSMPLQSWCGALQLPTAHWPFTQTAPALASMQGSSHLPQFAASVWVLTS